MYNILSPPITACYVRILSVEWHNRISMRMEIYGCAGALQPFRFEPLVEHLPCWTEIDAFGHAKYRDEGHSDVNSIGFGCPNASFVIQHVSKNLIFGYITHFLNYFKKQSTIWNQSDPKIMVQFCLELLCWLQMARMKMVCNFKKSCSD